MAEAEAITQELRVLGRKLLEQGTVDVVIGYGAGSQGNTTNPVFVTSPEQADRLVWNRYCVGNLAVYLTSPEIKRLGRPAVVAKGCDARAVVVLIQESQLKREDVVVIGVGCEGVIDSDPRQLEPDQEVELRLPPVPCLPPRGALRGLRGVRAGLPAGDPPESPEPEDGQGGGEALRVRPRHGARGRLAAARVPSNGRRGVHKVASGAVR
jgi:hypothetical protein